MLIPSSIPPAEELTYPSYHVIGTEIIGNMILLILIGVVAEVSMGEHELCKRHLG